MVGEKIYDTLIIYFKINMINKILNLVSIFAGCNGLTMMDYLYQKTRLARTRPERYSPLFFNPGNTE